MSSAEAPAPRLRGSLRRWIELVGLLAALPLLLSSALLLGLQLAERHDEARASLERRAQSAARAVALELQSVARLLDALTESDAMAQADLAALHRWGSRLVAAQPALRSLSLADAQGRLLFHTGRPYGSPLPTSAEVELLRRALEQGGLLVSPLLTGPVGRQPVVAVLRPVQAGGLGPAALRAALDPARFSALLETQGWPADWTAAVLDQNGVILARSREAARFVGQPAHEDLLRGLREGRSRLDTFTMTGEPVAAATAPVDGAGWTVVVGRATQGLRTQVVNSMLLWLGVALLCLLFSLAAVLVISRGLSRHLRTAVAAALAGDVAALQTSRITELAEVGRELHTLQQDADRSAERWHAARHDDLTGLPGRQLFLEQAGARIAAAHAQGRAAALLFIDLDGFKQVNDRFGHERGDQVLQQVATLLRQVVRRDDCLGRMGGDEFVLCLSIDAAGGLEPALEAGRRIVAATAGLDADLGTGLGCSVGVAAIAPGESLAQRLERADQAMLAAKRAGKGRVAAL